MLQILPIALAESKAINLKAYEMECVIYGMRIIYSFHWEKEVTKKYITIQWIQ